MTVTSLIGKSATLLALTCVACAVVSVFGTSRAAAADIASWSGSPGGVSATTLAVAAGGGGDIFTQPITGAAIGPNNLYVLGSSAYAGTQLVTITAVVRGCTGNPGPATMAYGCWIQGQRTSRWYIAPGAWRLLDATSLNVGFGTQMGGNYFEQLVVTWQMTSGYTLGTETINYRSPSDGACYTTRCQFWGPTYYSWTYQFS